jgi:hypothetical protein
MRHAWKLDLYPTKEMILNPSPVPIMGDHCVRDVTNQLGTYGCNIDAQCANKAR